MEIARWDTEKVAPSIIGLDIIGYTGSNPNLNWFLVKHGRLLILSSIPKPIPISKDTSRLADLLGNTEV